MDRLDLGTGFVEFVDISHLEFLNLEDLGFALFLLGNVGWRKSEVYEVNRVDLGLGFEFVEICFCFFRKRRKENWGLCNVLDKVRGELEKDQERNIMRGGIQKLIDFVWKL